MNFTNVNLGPVLPESFLLISVLALLLLEVLCQPYFIDGFEHNTTASIGITLFDGQPEKSDELLKRADIAMYQAKAAGRNIFCFFDKEMQDKVSYRAALSADLLGAVDLL
jgi:predicted signal transduction protein with EAL and GGDEF domain